MAGTMISMISYPVTDTVNNKVNTQILKQELEDASLSVDVAGVQTVGTTIKISLSGNASSDDFTECDSVIAAHEGADFSSDSQFAKSETESTSDTGSVVDKLTLDSGAMPAGEYMVQWYMEVACTTDGGEVTGAFRASKNGSALNILGQQSSNNSYWTSMSGSYLFTLVDGDTVDARLSYQRSGTSGNAAKVQRARIFLIKPGG